MRNLVTSALVAFVMLNVDNTGAATSGVVVGALGKFRPPVSVNGAAVTPAHDRKLPLHVGDVIHCGKGGDVTMTIAAYVVHPPCPYGYPIPNVAGQTDPGPALKEGAIVGVYKVQAVPNCGSASAAVVGRGGGDVAQGSHYTGVTCACPEDILDGQFCVDNETHAKIWYVRAWPANSSESSATQLLPPDQELIRGEVYQFEVPTKGGRCIYNVRAEFDDGTAAHWFGGNLCGTPPEMREWLITHS